MKILILEDDETRIKEFKKRLIGHEVTYTDSSKIAIEDIKENTYDILFLDHDLGGNIFVDSGENTGYEVAKWIATHKINIPNQIIIHSLNGVGAKNMQLILKGSNINSKYIPFAWLKI